MDIKSTRQGHMHVDGLPTGFWIESGRLQNGKKVWYLHRPGFSHSSFAWHNRRKDVISAARVFIEGATKKENESFRNMAIRALQSCLETGSRNVVNLR